MGTKAAQNQAKTEVAVVGDLTENEYVDENTDSYIESDNTVGKVGVQGSENTVVSWEL